MSQSDLKIGFVGGGNMARAIIDGLMRAGHPAGNIVVADSDELQRNALAEIHPELVITDDNRKPVRESDVVVLAVKPQIMASVAGELAGERRTGQQLIISIAAGISLQSLARWLGEDCAIVRVMPNQPALVGEGISVLVSSPQVSADQQAQARYITDAVGRSISIEDEALMDAVTAVSGSGPAYFYLIIESMIASAWRMGLDEALARELVIQTAIGAAASAEQSDGNIAALRESVTSKGGTTFAALSVLEGAGIRDIFDAALKAARDRSVELGGND